MTLIPAAWNTASNAVVKLASRSCRTNFTLIPASSRSISRFLACCTTQDWIGCSVDPRIRMRRAPLSRNGRARTIAALLRGGGAEFAPPVDRGGAPRRRGPGQERTPRPDGHGHRGAVPWPLALGDSELVPQHQNLGALPPLSPPRQPQQRYRTRDNQEDQLQA